MPTQDKKSLITRAKPMHCHNIFSFKKGKRKLLLHTTHTIVSLIEKLFPRNFLAIAKKQEDEELFYNVKEPFSASCKLGELSSSLTIGVLASDAFSLRESKYLLCLDETNPIAFYHEQHW